MNLGQQDREHIFESLRFGRVPTRGLDAYAVGIDPVRAELVRQLDFAKHGEGAIKFLRGDYGCGKTFTARLAVEEAQARGFATSFVVVSANDLRFHKFDEVYRRVVAELATATCPRGALGDILDRWIGAIEAQLLDSGVPDDAPDFDDRVRSELGSRLADLTGGKAPADFVRVIETVFDLKQRGAFAEAGALLSWLGGSGNVSAAAKRAAGVKGDITSAIAMSYLRGVLEIVKAAGYTGLLIVIDETETILRERKDVRQQSLNGIRQILDDVTDYPGLMWLFTGTSEFYDGPRGVKNLAPLHDRIAFQGSEAFPNLRQPQLRLTPFDPVRLKTVALRLRDLFPAEPEARARIEDRVDATFIEKLVGSVTAGFHGDVGVVPRQFLRRFIAVLDTVAVYPDYDPDDVIKQPLDPSTMSDVERAKVSQAPLPVPPDDDDGPMASVEVW